MEDLENNCQLICADTRNRTVRTHGDDVGVNIIAEAHVASDSNQDVYGRS